MCIIKSFFVIFLYILITNTAICQSKKALLIGIEEYNCGSEFNDLHGPKNDVGKISSLLLNKFMFSSSNVKTILSEEGTRENILNTLKNFSADIQKGDIFVFYYSGHGSVQKNSLSSDGTNQDEGIVPVDACQTGLLIRDKELAAIFGAMIDKGAVITCIYDCCHSGGLSRGFPVLNQWQNKNAPPFMGIDALDSSVSPNIIEKGALVITACTKEQSAKCRDGKSVFTDALYSELSSNSVSEPAGKLFLRVSARVQSIYTEQEPMIFGNDRMERTIFGIEPGDLPNIILIATMIKTDGTVMIQGGRAMGLEKGCILKKYSPDGKNSGIELEIDSVMNLNFSSVKLVKGSEKDVKTGDLFFVDRWKVAGKHNLSVWIPHSDKDFTELKKFALNVKAGLAGKVQIVDDPVNESQVQVLYYDDGWYLRNENDNIALGKNPTVLDIDKNIKTGCKLFISLPLPDDIYNYLIENYQTKYTAIQPVNSCGSADYFLYGMFNGKDIQYSWSRFESSELSNKSTLPVRTTWQSDSYSKLADSLLHYSSKLSRIKAWLEVSNPYDVENFPYSIALKRRSDNMIISGEVTLYSGDKCDLVLVAKDGELAKWKGKEDKKSRYIYVVGIDSRGATFLLYPQKSFLDNSKLPSDLTNPPSIIELESSGFTISPPFGTDTYILITSDSRIPDYMALEQSGVVFDTGTRKGNDPFDQFKEYIFEPGNSRRSRDVSISTRWSVNNIRVESKAKN